MFPTTGPGLVLVSNPQARADFKWVAFLLKFVHTKILPVSLNAREELASHRLLGAGASCRRTGQRILASV